MLRAKTLWLPIIGFLSFSLYLGGCSTTETVSNFLSSTSDWYGPDGLPKAEHKVDLFVALSLDNLKDDLARGQGEYLMALQTLLAVAPDRRGKFQSLLQENYSLIASQDRASVAKLLTALSHSLH